MVKRGKLAPNTDRKGRIALRRWASQFLICGGKLYKRHYQGFNLLCITKKESEEVTKEIHGGSLNPHINGHMLAKKIIRQGYFWTTLETDCIQLVRRCKKCQFYANLGHVPLHEPFSTWGINVIGQVHPKASGGEGYVLVLIRGNIIYHYGVPFELISEKGTYFEKHVNELMEELKITRHKYSPYRPQTNGAIEVVSKMLENIIRKMADKLRS